MSLIKKRSLLVFLIIISLFSYIVVGEKIGKDKVADRIVVDFVDIVFDYAKSIVGGIKNDYIVSEASERVELLQGGGNVIYVDNQMVEVVPGSIVNGDCINLYDKDTRECGLGTETAYDTVQDAADVVVAGDTVLIRGGTYDVFSLINKNGAINNPIIFRAYSNENPVLDAAYLQQYVLRIRDSSYITLFGLEFMQSTSHAIRVDNSDYINISNSIIHGAGVVAADCNPGTTAVASKATGVFLYADTTNSVVEYSDIYDNAKGIWLVCDTSFTPDLCTSYNTIQYNHVHDNLRNWGGDCASGASCGEAGDGIAITGDREAIRTQILTEQFNSVIGNVVYNNADDGIDSCCGTYGTIIKDNVVFSNAMQSTSDPCLVNGDGNGIKVNTNGGGNHRVYGNVIFNIPYGQCMDQDPYDTDWEANEFYDNTCFSAYFGGALMDHRATTLYSFYPKIRNNILYEASLDVLNNRDVYLKNLPSGTPFDIMHFSNNLFNEITITGAQPWFTWGNDPYNPSDLDFKSISGNPLFISNDINTIIAGIVTDLNDPNFGDVPGLHLQTTSPAIDAGVLIPGYHCPAPGQDSSGCREWYGSAPDIGVFEYVPAGECISDIDCDDGNVCTVNTCDLGTLTCVTDTTTNNGLGCSDSLFCTVGDICSAGVCSGSDNPCDDGISCTVGTCNEVADTCSQDTAGCECSSDIDCDDGNICTVNTCDLGILTCVTDITTNNGLGCNDNLYCNVGETCQAGSCTGGTSRDCSDVVSCTVDSCNEITDSCDRVPDNNLCNNGLFCDGAEICNAILDCQAGTAVDCSANNLGPIGTCINNPDAIPMTWDYRNAFTSSCIEPGDCTSGDPDIIHTCDVIQCGAECETNIDCIDTECDLLDGCYGNDYYDYSDVANSCLSDCVCEANACDNPVRTVNDARCIPVTECNDNTDNDLDGFTDLDDPGCRNDPLRDTEIGQCQDGQDNDGDTLIDYPADPGCESKADDDEADFIPGACGNDIIDEGEECDGDELGGVTCNDYGFNSGSLICTNQCTIDSSGCYNTQPSGGGGAAPSQVRQLPPVEEETCVENWVCFNWLECRDGVQQRDCRDRNNCGTYELIPETEKECEVQQEAVEEEIITQEEIIMPRPIKKTIGERLGEQLDSGLFTVMSLILTLIILFLVYYIFFKPGRRIKFKKEEI